MFKDLNQFNLSKEEKIKIYDMYGRYYSYVNYTKIHNEIGDACSLEYDLASIAGWDFREMCQDFGIKPTNIRVSENIVETYLLELEKFLETRKV